jgi:hypothetical protein
MTTDRRNPYVTLGVPFGASSDEAHAAFGRRARGLRRQPDGAERLRELTWALNQVTESLGEPELALHVYRVPSDPDAFVTGGPGVLSPAPERRGRAEGEPEAAFAGLLDAVRREAIAAIETQLANAPLPAR